MRVARTRVVEAPVERVWETVADWRTHPEWQPSLAEVEAPEVVEEDVRLVEVRASHGQRLVFDVVIREWQPGRLIRASGRSRGVVSVLADVVYELEEEAAGTAVTMAVEAEIPFVLLPLRHAVVTETEKEISEALARLATLHLPEERAL